MYSFVLKHPSDFGGTRAAKQRHAAALLRMLECFCQIAEGYYRSIPTLPSVYDAVFYREDPPGVQRWLDAATLLDEGYGDCKSLVPARVGELRVRYGIRAVPTVSWYRDRITGVARFHTVVCRLDNDETDLPPGIESSNSILWVSKNGRLIEDPSAVTGMTGRYFGRKEVA